MKQILLNQRIGNFGTVVCKNDFMQIILPQERWLYN